MARFVLLGFTCLGMTHGLQSDDACSNSDLRTQDVNSLLQAHTRHQQPVASLQLSTKGTDGSADANGKADASASGYIGDNKASSNPCEFCYNAQKDGTCIVSAIDGLCSNPTDTHYCSDIFDNPVTSCKACTDTNVLYEVGIKHVKIDSSGYVASCSIYPETKCGTYDIPHAYPIWVSSTECCACGGGKASTDLFGENKATIRPRQQATKGSWVVKWANSRCLNIPPRQSYLQWDAKERLKIFPRLTLLQCQTVILADPECSNFMYRKDNECFCVRRGETCEVLQDADSKVTPGVGHVYEWQATTRQAYESITANPEQYKLYKLVVTNSKSVAYCPNGDYLPKKKQAAPSGSRGYSFYWEHTGGKAFVGWFWQSQAWWFSGELKSDEKGTKAPKPGKWTKCTFEYEIEK